VMKQVLVVLKDSTIASKSGKDVRYRFWTEYKRVAEEHDSEFLDRCNFHRSRGPVSTLSSSGCLMFFLSTLLRSEWINP
ncbi:hypothetical protein BDR05DRAFT_878869, partial [Suillus weaverae]